jgi:hypothetical protein
MKKILTLMLLFPVLGAVAQKWEKNYDFVDNCVCGLSKVKKNDKVGYVNKEGIEVIKLQYDDGLTFEGGYAAVKKGSKWQYLDSTGKAITEAVYDDALSFGNGLAAVSKNNLYGFINTSGELVIPIEFSNARGFSEGLAPAANAKGYWGFVDVKGNWVIKPLYHFANNFEGGEARVMKGEKILYIDKENKVLHE